MRRSARISARKSLLSESEDEPSLETPVKKTPKRQTPSNRTPLNKSVEKKKAESTPSRRRSVKKEGKVDSKREILDVITEIDAESKSYSKIDASEILAIPLDKVDQETGCKNEDLGSNETKVSTSENHSKDLSNQESSYEEPKLESSKSKKQTDEDGLAITEKNLKSLKKRGRPRKKSENGEMIDAKKTQGDQQDFENLLENGKLISDLVDIKIPPFEITSKEIHTLSDTGASKKDLIKGKTPKDVKLIIINDNTNSSKGIQMLKKKEIGKQDDKVPSSKEMSPEDPEHLDSLLGLSKEGQIETEVLKDAIDGNEVLCSNDEPPEKLEGRKISKQSLNYEKIKGLNKSKAGFSFSNDPKRKSLMKLTSDAFKNLPFKITKEDLHKKIPKKKTNDDDTNADNVHKLDVISLTINQKKDEKRSLKDLMLSSELDPRIESSDLYFDIKRDRTGPVQSNFSKADEENQKKILKKSEISSDFERQETLQARESTTQKLKRRKQEKEETAGPGWYNLPKTEMTDEVKKDLQVIKMRHLLNPKRFYKKGTKKTPKHFQIGTVVEGSAEFYSSRITKKERKRTMVDELLNDAEFRNRNKRKYLEIQQKRESGGKKYHKLMKNKKKKTWERT